MQPGVNGLVVFPTFFNFSLNLARSSRSEPQSAPSLVFANCIELLSLPQGLCSSGTLSRDAWLQGLWALTHTVPPVWDALHLSLSLRKS